jgi:hypothetical protein
MRVAVDGNEIEVPGASTLCELLDGLAPRIDPARVVTRLEVDGTAADPTDRRALSAWRLTGRESLAIASETPAEFARARRAEIAGHLARIADRLSTVASGLLAGDTAGANRLLAAATRDLALVLQLDQHVALLDAGTPACGAVVQVVDRVGSQLTDAEQARRWPEVARLLTDELVPVLRAEATT